MVRNLNIISDIKAVIEIRKLLKEIEPDLIATHSSKAGLLEELRGGHYESQQYLRPMDGHIQMEFLKIKKDSILF